MMPKSGMHQGWSLPAGSCGVSEAAARAGLYTDHEVKDELVVGPECLQPRDVVYTLAAYIKEESELVKEADHPQEETECMTDRVKDEPSCSENIAACGVSAAAARTGLYAGHAVKDELVVGPEYLQPRDVLYMLPESIKEELELVKVADHPQEETECMADKIESLKEEPSCSANIAACGVSTAAARAGLYAGHIVKDELVLGPEYLQRPDVANLLYASTSVCVGRASSPIASLGSAGQQLKLRECVVRLERMDVETQLCTDTSRSMEQDGRQGVTVEPVDHTLSSIVCNLSLGRGGQQPSPRDCEVRLHHDTCRGTGQRPPALTTRADNHSIVEGIHERGTYLCDICKKRFALKSRLKKHMMVHISTPSVERMSGQPDRVSGVGARSSPRPAPSPSTHTARTHTTPAHNTTRGTALSGHTPAHCKKGHTCRVCGKEFQCQSELQRHERVHTRERPYSCGVCKKRFLHSGYLKTHALIHTGERPFSCGVCKKGFTRLYTLNAHERTHTGEKPYICDICSKQFTQSVHLKMHLLSHTGVKPNSCGVCKKKFSCLGKLKRHELIHTGEKPYSCEICDRKFRRPEHLRIHILVHTKKLSSCDMCAKQFRRKGNLVAHIRRHVEKTRSANTDAKRKVLQ